MTSLYRVGERTVRLPRLEKVLWPEEGLTKGDLVAYFLEVAPVLLPHIKGRPLTFTRWPDGIFGRHFFQKNPPPGAPDWLPTFPWGSVRYLLAEEPAALAALAGLACIEVHASLARCAHPLAPDLLVLDLDPAPPAGFAEVREVALLCRELLQRLGLEGFPKTSGAGGLHIYVPIAPQPYSLVQRAAKAAALLLRRAAPGLVTLERRVAARTGVYIDFLQNAPGRTMAAPYSPRALPGAPVSTPLAWDEVPQADPHALNLRTVPERLRRCGDLFAPTLHLGQSIAPLLEIAASLAEAGART